MTGGLISGMEDNKKKIIKSSNNEQNCYEISNKAKSIIVSRKRIKKDEYAKYVSNCHDELEKNSKEIYEQYFSNNIEDTIEYEQFINRLRKYLESKSK